jgi:hypothetical protein
MRLNAFEPADGLPLHPRAVRVGDCASDNKTIVGTDMDRYFSHHAHLAG